MPPEPRTRLGPRPLALHVGAAAMAAMLARSAWPAVRGNAFPWTPTCDAKAAELRAALQEADPEAFDRALDAETRRRADAFLEGIEAYGRHPYRRDPFQPPILWRDGTTRVLDYGPLAPQSADSRPVLLIPSLVNRAYILDLAPGSSLVRYLADRGLRPLLVDWDAPGEAERNFTLTDYVAGRLAGALDAARAVAAGPVPVIGYCMGGLLAVALAQIRPADVGALVALATPWDFHADLGGPPPLLALCAPQISAFLAAAEDMPVDLLQALFLALDPMLGWTKFRWFSRLGPDTAEARQFVALEDWANDGVPLAGPVARECLLGWYVDNTPARGQWRIAGTPILPEALDLPVLVVVPARDRIVPPSSARALAAAIPGADSLTPPAGHIGMAVGRRAEDGLWRPLADWLEQQT